ncbi:MAG TPA: hypothetical protein VGM76_13265 [Lacipirellulaceae bacterium]
MDPYVDIAFDCLPLRSVGRTDVPLDASPAFRARTEHLKRAIETHGTENSYFLYNAHCVYRLANSDVDGMLRFSFEGTLLTDRSDAKAERADFETALVGETCGDVPREVLPWLVRMVEQAVLVEFDRFVAAGMLAHRVGQLGNVTQLADLADFAGMNL